MNLIKQAKQILFKGTDVNEKEIIVSRLLQSGSITAEEAAVLLKGETRIQINIDKMEMSSGAKIVGGDDNETNYR